MSVHSPSNLYSHFFLSQVRFLDCADKPTLCPICRTNYLLVGNDLSFGNKNLISNDVSIKNEHVSLLITNNNEVTLFGVVR